MSDDTFPHKIGFRKIAALSEAQNHRCAYCGIRCEGRGDDENAPTVDHYVPVIAGGLRVWLNEVMACKFCNSSRGSMRAYNYFLAVRDRGRQKAAEYSARRQSARRKELNLDHVPAR